MISAAVGLVAGHWIAEPWLAASLGVGCAIALMALARCLHRRAGPARCFARWARARTAGAGLSC
jgi:CBS-domain-containing membrane protein